MAHWAPLKSGPVLADKNGMSQSFNIREDLQFRDLASQVEILWISGPTWHNAAMIADRLEIPESAVSEIVATSVRS